MGEEANDAALLLVFLMSASLGVSPRLQYARGDVWIGEGAPLAEGLSYRLSRGRSFGRNGWSGVRGLPHTTNYKFEAAHFKVRAAYSY